MGLNNGIGFMLALVGLLFGLATLIATAPRASIIFVLLIGLLILGLHLGIISVPAAIEDLYKCYPYTSCRYGQGFKFDKY